MTRIHTHFARGAVGISLLLGTLLSACGADIRVEPVSTPTAVLAPPATGTAAAPGPAAPTDTLLPAAVTDTPASAAATDTTVAAATDIPAPAAPTDTPPAPAAPTDTPPALATPTGTPAAPPAAGTGDLVFVLQHELAVVRADGSGLQHLGVQGTLSQPRWSPDKTRIAYIAGAGGDAGLWVVRADGSQAHALTHTPGVGAADPRWSPDGRTLAYVRTADTNHDGQVDARDLSEVWLVDVGGGNARRLADGLDPAWAPDGKRLAFATNGRRDSGVPAGTGNTIDMINAQGQNRWSPIKIPALPQDTSLVNPAAKFNAGTFAVRYPAWAPNNHAIAFTGQGHSGLIVTATDQGTNPTLRDFAYEGGMGHVFWAPDGGKLGYEIAPASGINQIGVLDLGTGRRITFGGAAGGRAATAPTWGPDSAQIAFVQGDPGAAPTAGEAGALVVARLADPAQGQVIVAAGAADPDWR